MDNFFDNQLFLSRGNEPVINGSNENHHQWQLIMITVIIWMNYDDPTVASLERCLGFEESSQGKRPYLRFVNLCNLPRCWNTMTNLCLKYDDIWWCMMDGGCHRLSWYILDNVKQKRTTYDETYNDLTYDDILVDDIFETAASLVGSLTA